MIASATLAALAAKAGAKLAKSERTILIREDNLPLGRGMIHETQVGFAWADALDYLWGGMVLVAVSASYWAGAHHG